MDKTEFGKQFGERPIFAGVYTGKSIPEIIDEVKQLSDKGIHIYFESLRSRVDQKKLSDDLNDIRLVLDKTLNKLNEKNIKAGINIILNPKESRKIAEKYEGTFVVDDAILGNYKGTRFVDKIIKHYDPDGEVHKSTKSGIILFGGITPGYLENTTSNWDEVTEKLNELANVILLGNSPTQTVMEQLKTYQNSLKPIIAAQGVNAKNLKSYFDLGASGAIIGSGLREKGILLKSKINKINDIRNAYN